MAQYTEAQFDAASKVAEDCPHNKLDTVACAACVAQHLADIGAGAKPDKQFFEEHKALYERWEALTATNERLEAEAFKFAETAGAMRAQVDDAQAKADAAEAQLANAARLKKQVEKMERRHAEITEKWTAVRHTLKAAEARLALVRTAIAAEMANALALSERLDEILAASEA